MFEIELDFIMNCWQPEILQPKSKPVNKTKHIKFSVLSNSWSQSWLGKHWGCIINLGFLAILYILIMTENKGRLFKQVYSLPLADLCSEKASGKVVHKNCIQIADCQKIISNIEPKS